MCVCMRDRTIEKIDNQSLLQKRRDSPAAFLLCKQEKGGGSTAPEVQETQLLLIQGALLRTRHAPQEFTEALK